MRTLTLTEHQITPAIPLSPAELDTLLALDVHIRIAPSRGREGHYDLTPESHVGTVRLPSLAFIIRPKLPISKVLFLILYALDPKHWRGEEFRLEEGDDLVEALAAVFAHRLKDIIRRGLLFGYRTEELSLASVRGRILFDEQLRVRYGIFPPAELRVDEFTQDIEENRLLRAAIHVLLQTRWRHTSFRETLARLDHDLGAVALCAYESQMVPDIQYNRLNEHYRPAVELARRILMEKSSEVRHGAMAASSFLVNMNDVFEDFIVAALREALELSAGSLVQGSEGHNLYLDCEGSKRLEPDISWWEGGRCRFVADVKYKEIRQGDFPIDDIYQMLAYTIAAELPEGLLIYPGNWGAGTLLIRHAGKAVQLTAVDLECPPQEILAQIFAIADYGRKVRFGVKST